MAIAFDAATDGGNNGGTGSLTFSHTCAGSDRLLLVGFKGDVIGGNDDITGVTYNGVAMTQVAKITSGANLDRFIYLYYLLNPASGANNVVISSTNNHYILGAAASYTGVAQSGQPDASATNVAGTGSSFITGTVTTVADNCWLMAVATRTYVGEGFTAGAGTTERVEDAALLTYCMVDSNAAITPAGSASLVVNFTGGTGAGAIIIASFSPAGGEDESSSSSASSLSSSSTSSASSASSSSTSTLSTSSLSSESSSSTSTLSSLSSSSTSTASSQSSQSSQSSLSSSSSSVVQAQYIHVRNIMSGGAM